jgi:aspartokinase-like uncharacterized kinase
MCLSHLDAVVKVGGSLYDWPDLAPRLHEWLVDQWNCDMGVLVIPGGGLTAEAVRQLDRSHELGDEKAHWLALRALTLNAHFLASLLPYACVIGEVKDCERIWSEGRVPILDVHEFACADDNSSGRLSHTWAVTSDALAARIAVVTRARHLVLLKSTTIPPEVSWTEAGQLGLVDEMFADVLRDAPTDLRVSAVNLRAWPN